MNSPSQPINQDIFLKEISELFLILFQRKSNLSDIPSFLERIGKATQMDEVCIFENVSGNQTRQMFHWNSECFVSTLDDEYRGALSWDSCPEVKAFLESGQSINDFEINSSNNRILKPSIENTIKSFLLIPIFVKDHFWGFMSLYSFRYKYYFTEAQIFSLISFSKALIDALGSGSLNNSTGKRKRKDNKTLALFDLVSKNVDDVLFLLDGKYRIIYCSPAYEKLSKSKLADNSSFLELFDLEIEAFSKALEFGVHKLISEKYFSSINRTVAIEHIIKPLIDETVGRGKFLISSRDVTDREKMLKNIKSNLNKERELNKLKSKFISMTSHELRTPLSTILSSVDLLEIISDSMVDQNHKEKLMKHIRKIQVQINRLNRIISEVFILEKSSLQNSDARLELIDVNSITKQILFNYFKDAFEQFELKLHEVPLLIKADKEWIINIIRNIIENAIKYGRPDIKKPVIITLPKENYVRFVVEDFGLGIPKEDQPFIFESFFRSSNVLNLKGTGLGLAIVKELVDKLKGKIHIESVVGTGTKVIIDLPYEKIDITS